jgi:hypothetical protein
MQKNKLKSNKQSILIIQSFFLAFMLVTMLLISSSKKQITSEISKAKDRLLIDLDQNQEIDVYDFVIFKNNYHNCGHSRPSCYKSNCDFDFNDLCDLYDFLIFKDLFHFSNPTPTPTPLQKSRTEKETPQTQPKEPTPTPTSITTPTPEPTQTPTPTSEPTQTPTPTSTSTPVQIPSSSYAMQKNYYGCLPTTFGNMLGVSEQYLTEEYKNWFHNVFLPRYEEEYGIDYCALVAEGQCGVDTTQYGISRNIFVDFLNEKYANGVVESTISSATPPTGSVIIWFNAHAVNYLARGCNASGQCYDFFHDPLPYSQYHDQEWINSHQTYLQQGTNIQRVPVEESANFIFYSKR